ncbi:MAG: hypothetical protein IH592_14130 [Bacteroidales bacterium]|nr:hypothetical protein [Bacteroidales bacterium]
MKEIGGFFELELNRGEGYHTNAISLNLGRTSLEYILKARRIRRLYLPHYACDALFEPLSRAVTEPVFYHINEELEPVFEYGVPGKGDYFLYINYFGIKDRFVSRLASIIPGLIVDNSQAFFAVPVPGTDTFYSPRKFFGVPDGGYLYTDAILDNELETDNSSGRFAHLVGRIEEGAGKSYPLFRDHEKHLSGQPLRRMSAITGRLLQNIRYDEVIMARRRNFMQLAGSLGHKNQITIPDDPVAAPLAYPFLAPGNDLRRALAKNRIYTAAYWPDVPHRVSPDSVESRLAEHLVPLPVDQRYGPGDIEFIIKTVLRHV